MPAACQTASVRAYPTVRLYMGAINGRQDARGVDIRSQQARDQRFFYQTFLSRLQAAAIVDFVVQQLSSRSGRVKDEL